MSTQRTVEDSTPAPNDILSIHHFRAHMDRGWMDHVPLFLLFFHLRCIIYKYDIYIYIHIFHKAWNLEPGTLAEPRGLQVWSLCAAEPLCSLAAV